MLLTQDITDHSSDLSYLDETTVTSTFIAEVKEKIELMRKLENEMRVAEETYKAAKERYETYKSTVVVAAFVNAGIEQIQDNNGNFVKLENKYYCNPNKNDADRMAISEWLKKNDGEHLLKHEGKVDQSQFDNLKAAGIPFADKVDINTNSLKSHLLGMLGYKKGSTAKITLEDIPDCIHFVVANEVVSG